MTLPSGGTPTPPELFVASSLESEARDRCLPYFFSSSSLFSSKLQPQIKASAPAGPAALPPTCPRPRPRPRPARGRRGRSWTQQASGTRSKRKQLAVCAAKGDRRPRQRPGAGRPGPAQTVQKQTSVQVSITWGRPRPRGKVTASSRPGSFGSFPFSLIRFQRPEKSRQLPVLSLDGSCARLKALRRREGAVVCAGIRPGAAGRVGSCAPGGWAPLGGGEVWGIDDGDSHATL